MAYTIFKTGGKQYRAATGDVLDVEKLDGAAGDKITFSEILFQGEGAKFKTGSALEGAKVLAEVVEQIKGPKLISFKFRRRKGYHRSIGHRQKLTRVKITSID